MRDFLCFMFFIDTTWKTPDVWFAWAFASIGVIAPIIILIAYLLGRNVIG